MADEPAFDQSQIDQLLQQASGAQPPAAGESPEGADAPAAQEKGEASSPSTGGQTLDQDEIDALARQAAAGHTPASPAGQSHGAAPAAQSQSSGPDPHAESLPEKDVEYLLSQAEQALQSIGGEVSDGLPPGAKTYQLEEFRGASASTEKATINLIRDVELDLKIELGRTHMYLEDVLKLRKGSVVPLDKLAGDPVDIYVNGRLIARGEVLVLNDNFCVRVAELIAGRSLAS